MYGVVWVMEIFYVCGVVFGVVLVGVSDVVFWIDIVVVVGGVDKFWL